MHRKAEAERLSTTTFPKGPVHETKGGPYELHAGYDC